MLKRVVLALGSVAVAHVFWRKVGLDALHTYLLEEPKTLETQIKKAQAKINQLPKARAGEDPLCTLARKSYQNTVRILQARLDRIHGRSK